MRVPLGVRAIVAATAGLAGASFLAALAAGAGFSLTTVALLAALAVVTEYFQVDAVEPPLNPADARTFSFSSGVHIAAVVVAGPAAAALVAVTGVVVVDLIRGAPLRRVTFNASTFALSALVGGLAFQAAGGTPGEVALPADMPAVAALALVYAFVNGVLVTAVVSAAQGVRFGFDALIADLGTDAAEASLGAALAVFALHEAWALVLLVPLAAATYQAHARLAMLRRQTARSLEVLANVIDERDPYTYRHSQRVSELVGEVAEGIGLPSLVAARLRWAGRLHDLGKIAVDAAVLRKPGALDAREWDAMRRHPRLSARLLRRFEFAAAEARIVEYHHERWDGQGYYGIERERVPLASHLLTVADTFDAMTSDRPYRAGLPEEDALAEIESQAGSQFHPAVARAFVAVRRGQDPETVLEAAELAELRSLSFDMPASRRLPEAAATLAVVVSVAIVLVGLGTGMPIVAGVGAAGAIALVGLRHAGGQRANRLVAQLAAAAAQPSTDRAAAFAGAATAFALDASWAGLVEWDRRALSGRLELEWGSAQPNPDALMSWLLRDADADQTVLREHGEALGASGTYLALPLDEGEGVTAFLVVGCVNQPGGHVVTALERFPDELRKRLARPRTVAVLPVRAVS
jgi:putative nucleotidyltransferase with HDIG domain